jgi:hypothetical protein
MKKTFKHRGYIVTGTYTAEYRSYGKRGEPPDSPPEPAEFEFESVIQDGVDILNTMSDKEKWDMEYEIICRIEDGEL